MAYIPKSKRCWALYKGDEYIDQGTVFQLSRHTGKSVDHLMWMTRPSYQVRIEKKRREPSAINRHRR